MNFKPCTEQEIADKKLWPKAVYPFEITEAAEKVSLGGNNAMKVKSSRPGPSARTITDYLLEKRDFELRHACAACALHEKYNTGCLAADDFVGKRGKLKLGIEKGKNGYPDKNIVMDYAIPRGVEIGGRL